MRLDDEDRRLLAGEMGPVAREAMEYQVEMARFYGADRMVGITQASAGMDYAMNGDYGLEFAEALAERGGRFRCFTKTAFMIMDLYRPGHFASPPDLVAKQLRLRDAFLRMGAVPTYSNLPFLMPSYGEDVVVPGGNTTLMANSYFGARTNLEGPIGGLMAALTARVPRTGLRVPENRRGNVRVDIDVQLHDSVDWDALGYAIGAQLPGAGDIPVFVGLPPIRSMGDRQRFDSTLSTTSSMMMYHVLGISPEARTEEEAFGPTPPARRIRIGQKDLQWTCEQLSHDVDHVDLVAFGGHHVELDEFPALLALMEGRRASEHVRVWLFTGPQYKAIIEALGYDVALKRFGAEIIYGTSLMFMTPSQLSSELGIRNVVCDSAKTAKYVKGFGMRSSLQSLQHCVEAAVQGKAAARRPGGAP